MDNMHVNNNATQQEEISLKELLIKIQLLIKYLFSKWYFILFAGILGGTIGFFYAKSKKPIYTASTTFVLESGDQGGGIGQYAGMAAIVGIDLGSGNGGIFQGDNLLELYKSRKMVEAALLSPLKKDSSILLIDRYLKINKVQEKWKEKSPNLLKINFNNNTPDGLERSKDSVISKVVIDINKNYLSVGKPDKKLSIIKVDVNSTDEVFSKEFNEAIVNEVNSFYVTTKTKKSLDNIAILQHKTDSVRAVMNGNIGAMATVIDATPNLNPTKQAQRLVPTQKSQFSAETNKAILAQLVQNLEMSKMALMKESPLIQKVDEPIYPLNKEVASQIKFFIVGSFILMFLFISFFSLKFVLIDIGFFTKQEILN